MAPEAAVSRKRAIGPILALVVCGAVVALALAHGHAVVRWIAGGGVRGLVAFAIIYLAATLLLVPPGILNAVAGALFGVGWGMAVVSCTNLTAAVIAFFLSRTVARQWAQRHIERRRRLLAMDRALERGGLKMVFLLRCSPVSPFAVVNYLLGLTRVRFRDYALGTMAGAAPGTFVYVYAGSAATSVAELLAHGVPRGGTGQQVLFWTGLAATLAACALMARYARRELHQEGAEHDGHTGSSYTEVGRV